MVGPITRECHLGIPLQASTSISPPCDQGSLEGEGVFYDCSVQTVYPVDKVFKGGWNNRVWLLCCYQLKY